MTTKIQKWGNSYAVRLPKAVIEQFSLYSNTEVDITVDPKGILLKPRKPQKPSLEEILKNVTPKMMESLLDWGPDVGSEILPPWNPTTRKKAK